jgi:hypothetical protein
MTVSLFLYLSDARRRRTSAVLRNWREAMDVQFGKLGYRCWTLWLLAAVRVKGIAATRIMGNAMLDSARTSNPCCCAIRRGVAQKLSHDVGIGLKA